MKSRNFSMSYNLLASLENYFQMFIYAQIHPAVPHPDLFWYFLNGMGWWKWNGMLLNYPYTNIKKMACPKKHLDIVFLRAWLENGESKIFLKWGSKKVGLLEKGG